MTLLLLELRMLRREPAALALLVLFALCLGYALHNGRTLAQAQRAQADALGAETAQFDQRLRSIVERQPVELRQAIGPGHLALLPPAPLAALASGQSDLLPSQERVILWRLESPSEAAVALANPTQLSTGRFDLAFVLTWLFPLFLLASIYDLCASDRESGTLRLALARGVGAWTLLGTRALARGLPVLALALGATALAGLLSPGGLSARASLALVVVVAYGLFWGGVALLVNGLARTAAEAATWVGTTWVVVVLVIPTLLNVLIETAHPMPSRAELVARLREASGAAERRSAELVDTLYREHPELAPPGMQADVLQQRLAVQAEIGRAMTPVHAAFDRELADQQAVVERWRVASPAIATFEALTDLAGTGYWRHRAFRDQLEVFEDQVFEFYSPRFHRRQALTQADLPARPRFVYQEAPPAALYARTLRAVAGVLALALVLLVVSGRRLSGASSGRLVS